MPRHRSTYRGARRNDVNAWMRRQEIPRGRRGPKGFYMPRVGDAALRQGCISGTAARELPEWAWVFAPHFK